jgi:hypothetical protein
MGRRSDGAKTADGASSLRFSTRKRNVIVSNNIYTPGGIDLSSVAAGTPYNAAGQRVVFSGEYEAAG